LTLPPEAAAPLAPSPSYAPGYTSTSPVYLNDTFTENVTFHPYMNSVVSQVIMRNGSDKVWSWNFVNTVMNLSNEYFVAEHLLPFSREALWKYLIS
jgi:hypothetical protein